MWLGGGWGGMTRTISGSGGGHALDTEVRGYIEDSLLCRLREGAEGVPTVQTSAIFIHRVEFRQHIQWPVPNF